MEIPAVLKELNYHAEKAFRNIGPIMPIKECEHKWEYVRIDDDFDRETGECWGYEVYQCNRCGAESSIGCLRKENYIREHHYNELYSLGLTYTQELSLQVGVLQRLLSQHVELDEYMHDYIIQLMVQDYHKGVLDH